MSQFTYPRELGYYPVLTQPGIKVYSRLNGSLNLLVRAQA